MKTPKTQVISTLALILGAPLFLQVGTASASSSSLTTITRFMDQSVVPNNLYVRLAIGPTRSNCHSNPSYHYVLDASTPLGEKMFSQLLTAFTAGMTIKLIGDDTCGLHTGIETLTRIEMWK